MPAHPFLSREFLEDERHQIAERWLPMLELNAFEANSSGRRFYHAYGFEVVGRHVNEAAGQPELRLRLADESDPV